MGIEIKDNVRSFATELLSDTASSNHALTLANTTEYALPLHSKRGYYVFNDEHILQTVDKHLSALVNSDLPLSDQNIHDALDAAGYEIIDFLRSYTDVFKLPVKEGEGLRATHPGGWADITNVLKNTYRHQVDGGPWVYGDEIRRTAPEPEEE